MFHPRQAAEYLRSLGETGLAEPAGGWPDGAPVNEWRRSPAAARVADLASACGLFLFQYEHRVSLSLPEDWVPEHAPELVQPPQWQKGVLPERKYHSFRHDQAIGGFHAGHRAKWSTHELCHGLVGFTWYSGMSQLALATAGRTAELLPVVLWYFLDECFLRRCPVHAYGGALYRGHCVACEASAGFDAQDPRVMERLEGAARYLDREMAAIVRTRRFGRPVPHIWGSLDLCSDGVAYAAAHGARCRSEVFHYFAERFLVEGGGWFTDAESLQSRLEAVVGAMLLGETLAPWAESASEGRARWMAQDLAWRLLTIAHQTDLEAKEGLLQLVDRFAETQCEDLAVAIEGARVEYAALNEVFMLPDWSEVSAVGYDLPGGGGRSTAQLAEGIRSAFPATSTLYGEGLDEIVGQFIVVDAPARKPLAQRLESWWTPSLSNSMRDLVQFESMQALVGPPDAQARVLTTESVPPDRIRCAEGVIVRCFGSEPMTLCEEVLFGDRILGPQDELPDVDGQPVPVRPCSLLCFRETTGAVQLVELDAEVGAQLAKGGSFSRDSLEPQVLQALWDLGVLVPERWSST